MRILQLLSLSPIPVITNNIEKALAKRATLIGGIVAILAYAYVVLRGYFTPPFCDEVFTFFNYIKPNDFIPFYAKLDANNHLINSALSRIFYVLFGGETFVLRLANMLAFGGYIFYAFRFKRFFQNSLVWLAWFTTMVATQFFIDFFHLSRGYGLSMLFLLASLFHVLIYNKQANTKHFLLAMAFISLALWSNLSLLISALCIASLLVFLWIGKNRTSHSTTNHIIQTIGLLAVFIAPSLTAIFYGFELKNTGSLYYGADSDFWHYSIVRTVRFMTNHWTYSNWLAAMCVLTLALVSIWNIVLKKAVIRFHLHLVLWGSVIGIIALHHFNGVNYPVDRAVLHLFLVFLTLLFLEIDLVQKKAFSWFAFAIALSSLSITVINANLTHTNLWNTVHLPKSYYTKIAEWKNDNHRNPTIAAHGLHQFVLSYFSSLDANNLPVTSHSEYPSSVADFVIIKDNIQWENASLYDTIYYNPELESGLMQLRVAPVWEMVDFNVNNEQDLKGEFVNLADFKLNNLDGEPVLIEVEFNAQCLEHIRDLHLVFKVLNSNGVTLVYKQVNLNSTYLNLNAKQMVSSNYLLEKTPVNASNLIVFIWNNQEKPLTISNTNIRLFAATDRP